MLDDAVEMDCDSDASDSLTERRQEAANAVAERVTKALRLAEEALELRPDEMHTQLQQEGWVELPAGLPKQWTSWDAFRFVEEYHAAYAALVEDELAGLLRAKVRSIAVQMNRTE